MKLIKVISFALILGSLALLYYLYNGIQTVIDEREVVAYREGLMQERLKLIREAELLFQEQYGRYTSNWDSLADFIEKGQVPIIQITEIIKQEAYGVEKVTQKLDTLGFDAAKDRIFKKKYTMNAADDGEFMGFKIKIGDRVIKGQAAYQIGRGDSKREPNFIENGIISSLADLKEGDPLKKGQNLINFWDYQFNPEIDLRKIGEVPYTPGKMITIFTGKVNKNGLMVDVIEVVDPDPVDKSRKESNEAKIKKPLRFGSRLDANTSGNWE